MPMPQHVIDQFRSAFKLIHEDATRRSMAHSSVCDCGSCRTHYDRALEIALQLANDGQCIKSIMQIAEALNDFSSLLALSMGLSAEEVANMGREIRDAMIAEGASDIGRFVKYANLIEEAQKNHHR